MPCADARQEEHGLRAGTEDVAFAVALETAAELVADDLAAGSVARLTALRDTLHAILGARLPGRVHLNGHRAARLPQTLNLRIDGVVGHDLLVRCPAIATSTGSACHSGSREPSPVLTVMGLTTESSLAALRLTLGRWTDYEGVAAAADALAKAIAGPPT